MPGVYCWFCADVSPPDIEFVVCPYDFNTMTFQLCVPFFCQLGAVWCSTFIIVRTALYLFLPTFPPTVPWFFNACQHTHAHPHTHTHTHGCVVPPPPPPPLPVHPRRNIPAPTLQSQRPRFHRVEEVAVHCINTAVVRATFFVRCFHLLPHQTDSHPIPRAYRTLL